MLGGEGLREKIKGMLKGRPMSQEVVERKRLGETIELEEIIRTVAMAF